MFNIVKSLLITLFFLLVILALVIFGWLWQASAPLTDMPAPSRSEVYLSRYQYADEPALALLASTRETHHLPSLSAAIAVDGELVWAGAAGYRDVTHKQAADPQTIYRIGSISKSMTAALLARLQQEQRLDMDEPLGTYTGELPPWTQITLRQLANHQGGVRHYHQGPAMLRENFHNTHYHDTQSALTLIQQDQPLFTPGSDFLYSTYGYTLLAYGMERATHTDFATLLHETLIKPLGLVHTALDGAQPPSSNTATAYIALGEHNYRAPTVDLSYKYAGGGIVSTPSDLVTFGTHVLNGDWLSDDSRSRLWQVALLNNGQANSHHYTLGFRLHDTELGPRLSHGGMSVGGFTYLAIYPDQSLVVALATNTTPDKNPLSREALAEQIARLFMTRP